jgi:long-chain acyl-CoA synthetase
VLLPELLRRSAKSHPDKPAVVFTEGSITFAELDRMSDRVAAHLSELGVGPGERVGILSENTLAAIVWFWGVLKSGAQSVDVPSLAGQSTILEVLDEARPKALAVQPKLLDKLIATGHRLPEIVLSSLDQVPERSERFTLPAMNEDDVAVVVYTSGTTGRPKGVMLSHQNLWSNISSANELVGLSDKDSILLVVPFYFIHGRMQLLTHMMIAGTVVVSTGFQFPAQVLQELVQHRVTGLSGVPYHFITLMERTKLKSTPLPDLKYVLVTGGALALPQLDQLHAALPNAGIHTAYGQTEASPRITYLAPEDMFGPKKGSAGKALPGVTVEVVDGSDPVPQGDIGEVVAGGPNIMKGYVSGDHVTSGRLDDRGRLRTGDLGRFDIDGYLWLVGRSSDMIKTAGERIFPKEIEDVVSSHPAVLESAVIGVKDELLGEKLVVFAVLRSGHTLAYADLRAHCLQSLPFVRVPRELVVVDNLPKTGSGKIDRGAVKALPR